MKRTACILIGILVYLLGLCSCEDDSSISGTSNDSTTVLLNHRFTYGVNPAAWNIRTGDYGSYQINDGILWLESQPMPGLLGNPVYMLSNQIWTIEEGESYRLTIIGYLSGCTADGDQSLGFKCNSADISGSRFLGLEFRSEYPTTYISLIDQISDCGIEFPPAHPSPLCEDLHEFAMKITSQSIVFYADHEVLGRIEASQDCDLEVNSFRIFACVRGYYYLAYLGIDQIILEKYK